MRAIRPIIFTFSIAIWLGIAIDSILSFSSGNHEARQASVFISALFSLPLSLVFWLIISSVLSSIHPESGDGDFFGFVEIQIIHFALYLLQIKLLVIWLKKRKQSQDWSNPD